jgi:DNA-directed RNA polymerase specialized sigma24 family protein
VDATLTGRASVCPGSVNFEHRVPRCVGKSTDSATFGIVERMKNVAQIARAERSRVRAELIVLLQHGDRDACRALLDDIGPSMMQFLRRRVADPGELEDVYQEVFLALYEARHSYQPGRPLEPWLFATASNIAADHRGATGLARAGNSWSPSRLNVWRSRGRRHRLGLSRPSPVFAHATRGLLDAQAKRDIARGRGRTRLARAYQRRES